MLWTLLRTMELHARNSMTEERSGELVGTTLILEPQGGGGDLQETSESVRTIQQLKARSGGGTWSLREVVESVLPDLYLAVDLTKENTQYVFITEGRIDGWRDIYESFFQSLASRTSTTDDIRSTLDGSKLLGVVKQKPRKEKSATGQFWTDEDYTERQLFDRVVAEIRKREKIQKTENVETTQKKLWHLLSRFSVLENQSRDGLRAKIDRRLHELVDYVEDLDGVRNSLLTSLAVLASRGDADITDARAFLSSQGLRARPFSDWPDLIRLSHERLEQSLRFVGYQGAEDVRRESAGAIAKEWPIEKPVLLLTGESGQGKSWRACSLAKELTSEPGLVVLVDGAPGLNEALREASSLVWRDIMGHDQELSLDRIALRLRESYPERAARWLILIIDGLRDPSDARVLAKERWSELGIRVIVSCDPDVAASITKAMPERLVPTVTVDAFTMEELQRYLSITVGPNWPKIPGNVRDTLRRPLLARLYREVAGNEPWKYTNEFTLYGRFWARLEEDDLASKPLTKVALERLALSLFSNAPYPWTARQLADAGMDNEAVGALMKVGWLRRTMHDRFEVLHDRLLNWAVATALVNALRAGALDRATFYDRLVEVFRLEPTFGGRRLGYVAMDVLWLITRSTEEAGELIDATIDALEGEQFYTRETLYRRILPTLGISIIPSLFRRLPLVAMSEDVLHESQVVHAIIEIDCEISGSLANGLLQHESRRVQRSAMRILARRPSADALDRLWALHVQMKNEPHLFLRKNEHEVFLYDQSFGALRSCVKLDPLWIERKIEGAESSDESEPIHDLAYLLGNIERNVEIWRRCKLRLLRLIPPLHDRSLIANIFVHGDNDELNWLVERVSSDVNFAGSWAMKALAKLEPDLAVEHLPRVPIHELGPTKHWYVLELLAKRPEATRAQFLSMMKAADDPWDVALVFENDVDSIDENMLDILVSDLSGRLESDLSAPRDEASSQVYRPLMLLSRINRLELLERLQLCRGTLLEERMTEWMLREGPQPDEWNRPMRVYGIEFLQKIGGTGFTRVINEYLKASNRWGRLPGLELAFKLPDAETVELLRSISQQEELWGDYILEQTHAIEALAYLDQWDDVVLGIMRWGLLPRFQLTDGLLSREPLDETSLEPAIAEVSVSDVPSPGSVFVLGLSRWRGSIERVRSAFASAPIDSELALSCMVTLGLCEDASPDTVSLIVEQLGVENHRWQTKIALMRIGTTVALNALLTDVEVNFDSAFAIDLYQRVDSRKHALEIIKARLNSSSASAMEELLGDLLELSDDLVAPFLENVRIRDLLRERSFADEGAGWRTGSKVAAIQGLSLFDRESATLAALKALENPNSHDREHYPYLIIKLEGERAVRTLLEQVASEKSTLVVWAIARALDEAGLGGFLTAMLTTGDASERLAGSRVAERMRVPDEIMPLLKSLVEDPDEAVCIAAIRALAFQRSARNADVLLGAFLGEKDASRRWILIDAIMEVADPGDGHRPFPRWVDEVFGNSPQLERIYVAEKLKKRRKQLQEEATKRDKK